MPLLIRKVLQIWYQSLRWPPTTAALPLLLLQSLLHWPLPLTTAALPLLLLLHWTAVVPPPLLHHCTTTAVPSLLHWPLLYHHAATAVAPPPRIYLLHLVTLLYRCRLLVHATIVQRSSSVQWIVHVNAYAQSVQPKNKEDANRKVIHSHTLCQSVNPTIVSLHSEKMSEYDENDSTGRIAIFAFIL